MGSLSGRPKPNIVQIFAKDPSFTCQTFPCLSEQPHPAKLDEEELPGPFGFDTEHLSWSLLLNQDAISELLQGKVNHEHKFQPDTVAAYEEGSIEQLSAL